MIRGDRVRLAGYKAAVTGKDSNAGNEMRTTKKHPLLVARYDLLLKSFWQELARAHNFFIRDFIKRHVFRNPPNK